MRYQLICTTANEKKVIEKYPVINKYNPIIDYPYPDSKVGRLSVEVDSLIDFFEDIGEEIILGKDFTPCDNMYYLEIYDGYRE